MLIRNIQHKIGFSSLSPAMRIAAPSIRAPDVALPTFFEIVLIDLASE